MKLGKLWKCEFCENDKFFVSQLEVCIGKDNFLTEKTVGTRVRSCAGTEMNVSNAKMDSFGIWSQMPAFRHVRMEHLP